MIFKSPSMRLSVSLALLIVNWLFIAQVLGFIPDKTKSAMELRKSLAEALALQFSAAFEKGEFQILQTTLRAVVDRTKEIRSAAIRVQGGKLIALAGEHLANWRAPADGKSTPTYVHVPLLRNGVKCGTVEICFAPLWMDSLLGGISNSFVGLLVFVGLSCFISYFLIIKRTLKELDPTAVIPERVQRAFDILREGIIILDEKEHIVLSNKSFAALFGKSPEAMIGLKGSELGWIDRQSPQQLSQLPWLKLAQNEQDYAGASLRLINSKGNKIKLVANATRVIDNRKTYRGALVAFDSITQIEEKNFELNFMVNKLQDANEEIRKKSEVLDFLAKHDALTLCLNRRSFNEFLLDAFNQARTRDSHLSCIMIDIDFFKSVNDRYGHATGDRVIMAVADILKTSTRNSDRVSRYGGEEFCVVLPGMDLQATARVAERMRAIIEKKPCAGVKITISLGVSSLENNAGKAEELISQADKALYIAKNSGRNRVVSWGRETEIASLSLKNKDANRHELECEASKMYTAVQKQLQDRVSKFEGLLEQRTAELKHHQMYDEKTGFPTLALFEDRLAHEIARSKRKKILLAVVSATIDTAKRVCETLGDNAAQELVIAWGQRLNRTLRSNIGMVAMLNADSGTSTISGLNQAEFGILLTDIKQVDHVTWVIKRMIDAFEEPFQLNGTQIYASVYYGVSLYPHDGETVEKLYSSAVNASAYAKKRNGIDRYMFASSELNDMAASQLQIESLLHKAIPDNELQLHYQPKIEAATGRVAGFEALLRWRNPVLGVVLPNKFIPIAERGGLIDKLGDWIIRTACRQLRDWMNSGLEVVPISINMSSIQLRQNDLATRCLNHLKEFDIDSNLVEIELTESELVNNYDNSMTRLKQLKEAGFRLIMDDFGTGYSSLSYLRKIPLSGIKIDKSFIDDIDEKNEDSINLIASIISISHSLGLQVVAEGVESKHQAEHLASLGCELLQGYYFSRPVSSVKAADIIKEKVMVPSA